MTTKQKPSKSLNLRKSKLLGDNILVKAIIIEHSGIVVRPQQYEDKPEFAEVIAVGEGMLLENGSRIPMTVKKGDTILFQKHSAQKIRSEGEDFLLIHEDDVYAIV